MRHELGREKRKGFKRNKKMRHELGREKRKGLREIKRWDTN